MTTAYYPSSIQTWTDRVNNQDPVVAADVNTVYAEVNAIETTLGVSPALSPTWGSGTFNSTTTSWTNVKARLDNLENGVYTAFNSRVSISGGSIITQPNTTTVGLRIVSNNTISARNLIEFADAGGNTGTVVGPNGYITRIYGGTA